MNRRVHLNSAAALSKQWGPPLPVSVTIDLLLGLAGHIQKHVQPTHLNRVTTGPYGSPYRGQGGIEGGQVRPRDFLAAKAGHRRQKQEHQAAG